MISSSPSGVSSPACAILGRNALLDEVEVERVQTKSSTGVVVGPQGLVVALVPIAQLGGDEDLLARQARRSDGGADPMLVHVGCSGVDVAVPDL